VNESSVVSFDGTTIWMSDSQGNGPVVVLLHGATMTSITNFETRFGFGDDGRIGPVPGATVASALRDAGARVVGVDARGHGRSGRSPDPARYRGDAHARDVQPVIGALGGDEVDVVGYSMGAMTAARLLGDELRLRSVALCGTGPDHVEGHATELLDRMSEVGRCFQSGDWANHPKHKPYRAMARLDPVHDFASIGAALIGLDPVPVTRLEDAATPVLVLNGGGDDPDDAAIRLAAMIPGADALVAGSADHALACSDDDFQSALVSFLRERWQH
jgi:pimeloyl-ACP methyl ester carboxylesterase